MGIVNKSIEYGTFGFLKDVLCLLNLFTYHIKWIQLLVKLKTTFHCEFHKIT